MLAREQVLHSLLELVNDAASLTPVELGDRVLRIALSLVDCEAAALLAPRHRDALRLLRRRGDARYEPEVVGRDGSGFLRLIARRAHPFVTTDVSRDSRAARDGFPELDAGPAVFVPFGSRDTSHGYLAAYRARSAPAFDAHEVRRLTMLATSAALALENRRLAQDLQRLAVTDDLTQV